jgi:hypothetical protein
MHAWVSFFVGYYFRPEEKIRALRHYHEGIERGNEHC